MRSMEHYRTSCRKDVIPKCECCTQQGAHQPTFPAVDSDNLCIAQPKTTPSTQAFSYITITKTFQPKKRAMLKVAPNVLEYTKFNSAPPKQTQLTDSPHPNFCAVDNPLGLRSPQSLLVMFPPCVQLQLNGGRRKIIVCCKRCGLYPPTTPTPLSITFKL